MNSDEEFLEILKKTFIEEAMQLLEEFEESLLQIESADDKTEVIAQLFRTAHSLKGSAAAVDYKEFSKFAHHMEDGLSILRAKPWLVGRDVISVMLECSDLLSKWINSYYTKSDKIPTERFSLLEKVKLVTANLKNAEGASDIGDILVEQGSVSRDAVLEAAKTQEELQGKKFGEILVSQGATTESDVDKALSIQKARGKSRSSGFLKIDADRVSAVNELVGELVVIKSQLMDLGNGEDGNSKIGNLFSLLDKTVRDLYERTLSMQMMSLKQPFMRLERCIRDTSIKVDKPVRLVTSGEDTELDRNIIEKLIDPLMHVCRNSVDHGIEPKADRLSLGKEETGHISLTALRSGSSVVIEIKDDGRGICRKRVIEKGVSMGAFTREETNELSDEEIYNCIFRPSFSTADEVTDVSGRGVGLDVVRTTVDELNGKIEVESVEGMGSTFRLILPISNSITDGVVVSAGQERYILPLENIKEFVTLGEGTVSEIDRGKQILELRGQYYPIHRLTDKLEKPSAGTENLVVLVQSRDQTAGLLVDEIIDQNQVVLKGIDNSMDRVEGIAGAAILGNGKVALILDVPGLMLAA